MYNINYALPGYSWGQVLKTSLCSYNTTEQGYQATGPWTIDVNHRESNLLVGPFVIWTNTALGITGVPSLSDRLVRIRTKFNFVSSGEYDSRIGGKLVFWFQSRLPVGVSNYGYGMPERIANYYWPVNMLGDSENDVPVELNLTSDMRDWMGMGKNPIDPRPTIGSAVKYCCALNQSEFTHAINNPVNMGVLLLLSSYYPEGGEILWLNASNPNSTPTMTNSSFYLKEFTLVQ